MNIVVIYNSILIPKHRPGPTCYRIFNTFCKYFNCIGTNTVDYIGYSIAKCLTPFVRIVPVICLNEMYFIFTFQGLQSEWQRVFYIAAGIDVIGAIVCVTCLSVTLQKWALTGYEKPSTITYEIKITDPLTIGSEKS